MKKVFVTLSVLLLSVLFALPSNAQPSGSAIFQQFPWLSDLVNEEQCTNERIDVYESGIHSYVLITDSMGASTLYNQEGQFYCLSTIGYDCIALYNLGAPTTTWSCNSGIANCDGDDQLISRLIEGYDSGACYVTTSVSQLNYNGKTYFRTYRGRTRKGIELAEFPCFVQEFFGDVRDCNYRRVCAFGLFNPDATIDPELCTAIASGQLEEMVIWENPDATCPDTDPFQLPVIQEAINREPIMGMDGLPCETIKEIVKFEVYGFTYYRINEIAGCASDNADRFFDCEGNYVGGIGFAPLCQSANFCTLLDNSSVDGEVIWSSETAISNDRLFDDYPWLSTIVDQDNCTTERVDVHMAGDYIYLIVTGADQTEMMYNAEGLFYCQSGLNLDCVSAYNLGAPIDSWTCGEGSDNECENIGTVFFDICGDGQLFYFIRLENGVALDPYLPEDSDYVPVEGQVVKFGYDESAFQTPCSQADLAVDITCIEVVSTPSITADCSNNQGTIFFESCDDGTEYFFVRTGTGEVLDIYFAAGVAFDIEEGQSVNFDFMETSFISPCSIADRAVIVTCIEEAVTSLDLFLDYPFIVGLLDQDDCSGTFVNEYELGGFNFLFIGTSVTDGKLYRYDGVFYCESTSGYNCIEAYGFGSPTRTFSCADTEGAQDEIAKSRSQKSPMIVDAFPNPTLGDLTIRWSTEATEIKELKIIDISGRVLSQQFVLPDVASTILDLSGYQSGVYFIEMSGATERVIHKVIRR